MDTQTKQRKEVLYYVYGERDGKEYNNIFRTMERVNAWLDSFDDAFFDSVEIVEVENSFPLRSRYYTRERGWGLWLEEKIVCRRKIKRM